MQIDVHAHFIHPSFFDPLEALPGVWRRDLDGGAQELRRGNVTLLPRRDAWFDDNHCIADMDRKGIDIRLLSLTAPNVHAFEPAAQASLARAINAAAFERCRRHPSRLRALACLPLADTNAALAELDLVAARPMCVGISMGSSNGAMPLNHPSLDPVWRRINELRLPVVEHPGHPLNTEGIEEYELPIRVGFMFETTVALTRMIYSGIFERYSDFPYVVAHTGAALLMFSERLDNGYRLFPDCRKDINRLPSDYIRRLHFDSCAFGRNALMFALSEVGAGHILLGTDYPFIDTDAGHVKALPVDAAARELMLWGNAARLFGLGDLTAQAAPGIHAGLSRQ